LRSPTRLAALAVLALVAAGAASAPSAPAPTASPRFVLLGTAQDGGLPQTACGCSNCTLARRDPSRARRVASLAIHFPSTNRVYLVDATPDLPAQIDTVRAFRRHPEGRPDREPLDGVLLTHAHMGHYLGLAHLGFESVNAWSVTVWGSSRMLGFLRDNGPWSQLVRLGNIDLVEARPGTPVGLGERVSATPLAVPHRDEFSDTVAWILRGPGRTVLYVPDTDDWVSWDPSLLEVLDREKVDVALLDATFYSGDELPDRDVSKIRHPLVTRTMDLLEPRVKSGRLRVLFTHLNHTNPANDPGSAARKAIEARGFEVAEEGMEIGL
jgi:pyrroloquinoline quinone biosynthesis protein B